MTEPAGAPAADTHRQLTRTEASAAVERLGWRLLLGSLQASCPVDSLTQAATVAAAAVDACRGHADGHLRVDLRPDRVELSLSDRTVGAVTRHDVELAEAVIASLGDLGVAVAAPAASRPVQALEIAIDALDIPAVRGFWRAALGYVDEVTPTGGGDGLVDPAGQLPTVWFQQMDEPRAQRNRIHFDVTVPHDAAPARIAAIVAAGGAVLSDEPTRAFTILADAEGNEACVCTWQDRDAWDTAGGS